MCHSSHAFLRCTALLSLGFLLSPAQTGFAAIIFQQDFSSSTTVSDYVTGGAASGSLFSTIGTDAGAAGLSQNITSGTLELTGAAAATLAQGARATFGASESLLQTEFSINVAGNNTGTVDRSRITFGTNAVINGNYGNTGGNTSIFADFLVRTTSSSWRIDLENNTGEFITSLPFNTDVTFRIYMNNSGATINGIMDPLGGTFSLDNDSVSVFYNTGVLWVSGISNQNDSGKTGAIEAFRFTQFGNATGSTLQFDDFTIANDFSSIPEPSGVLLCLAGAGMLVVRRVRRAGCL